MKTNNTRICRLCGSDDVLSLYRLEEHGILKCTRCGLLFNSCPLDKHWALRLYDKNYFVNSNFYQPGRYFGYPNYPRDRQRLLKTFHKRLDTIETFSTRGALLDIGSALGYFLEAATNRGWHCLGCDISRYAVDYAKQGGHKVTLGEINAVTRDDFDVITMFDLLEHVEDPLAQLQAAFKRLKNNGLLVLTFPDAGSWPARLMKQYWPEWKRVKEHNYFFSAAIVRQLLERSGFQIRKKEHAGKVIALDSLLSEISFYNQKLYRILRRLAGALRLADKEFFFIPLYKTTLYATKKGPKPAG